MGKQRAVLGLAALTAALLLVWTAAEAPSRDLTRVRLTINSKVLVPGIANLWVGQYLGYFAAEGIEPQWATSEGAGQNFQLLLTGATDIALGIQDPILIRAAKGEDPTLIMVYNYNRGIIYRLGVKPESTIREVAQLKGRKIGILSFAHPGLIYAKIVLRDAGLDPEKDVEYLVVGQGAPAGKALYDGAVDVLAYWDFHWLQLEGMGFKVRLLPQPTAVEDIRAGHALAVRRDYLEKNRSLLAGFLRAVAKGTVFTLENPEAAVRIHFKMFPESIPKGVDFETAVRRATAEVVTRAPLLRKEMGGLRFFGEFGREAWLGYAKFLALAGKVDPARYYTNDLIREANDFDVEKIRRQASGFTLR